MKKILIIILAILMITGCGKTTKKEIDDNSKKKTDSVDNYSGKETALSKKYLSKGYLINIYRSYFLLVMMLKTTEKLILL